MELMALQITACMPLLLGHLIDFALHRWLGYAVS
jgi:hypothetical protein